MFQRRHGLSASTNIEIYASSLRGHVFARKLCVKGSSGSEGPEREGRRVFRSFIREGKGITVSLNIYERTKRYEAEILQKIYTHAREYKFANYAAESPLCQCSADCCPKSSLRPLCRRTTRFLDVRCVLVTFDSAIIEFADM